MSPTPGTRLGPYEIDSLLGEGGMGEVSSTPPELYANSTLAHGIWKLVETLDNKMGRRFRKARNAASTRGPRNDPRVHF